MTHVYTVGYEGHSPESFVALLEQNGIACLIDVRESPNSRKPGFSKKKLATVLEESGISYVHLPELGTPKPLRDLVKKEGDYDTFFSEYARHLDGQPEALSRLRRILRARPSCLMCYENDPQRCHRSVLGHRLAEKKGSRFKVHHL